MAEGPRSLLRRANEYRRGLPRALQLAVVAAVAVAVAGVGLAGLIGAFGPVHAAGGSGGVSLATASQAAGPYMAGSGWVSLGASGADDWNATSLSLGTPPTGCVPDVLVGSLSAGLALPAYRGNLTDGSAALWLLEYGQLSTGTVLDVAVTAGVVTFAMTLNSTSCDEGFNASSPTLDLGSVIGSGSAAAIVGGVGAYAFVAGHPTGLSLVMIVVPELEGGPNAPEWLFDYSTCANPLGGVGGSGTGTGTVFEASLNAETGGVLGKGVTSVSCSGGVAPPSSSIAFDPPVATTGSGTLATTGCASGDACYSIEVQSAENVTASELDLYVLNATDSPNASVVESVAGYAIASAAGTVLVYSTGPLEYAWTSAAGTPSQVLSAGMTVWVDCGTTSLHGAGDTLVVAGVGGLLETDSMLLP
jgi:hypothetical protein